MTFTIRNLSCEHGYWTATLRANGHSILVSRKSGSWQTPPDEQGRTREVLPAFAAALQERVRKLERKRPRT